MDKLEFLRGVSVWVDNEQESTILGEWFHSQGVFWHPNGRPSGFSSYFVVFDGMLKVSTYTAIFKEHIGMYGAISFKKFQMLTGAR